MSEQKAKVYVALGADLIHEGHLNVINKGASLGELTVGVLTDKALASYKRLPVIEYEQRELVVKALKGVTHVVKQETASYKDVLTTLKPQYVVHGDDWKEGVQSKTRAEVVELLAGWGGELVEIAYTHNLSGSIDAKRKELSFHPGFRARQLRRLIASKGRILWLFVLSLAVVVGFFCCCCLVFSCFHCI
jgi:cytidyltransferase-like protein